MYLTRAADVRLRSESLPSARRRQGGARNVTMLFPSVRMRPPPPPATLIRLPRLSLLNGALLRCAAIACAVYNGTPMAASTAASARFAKTRRRDGGKGHGSARVD